jgi:hypothetical protein
MLYDGTEESVGAVEVIGCNLVEGIVGINILDVSGGSGGVEGDE